MTENAKSITPTINFAGRRGQLVTLDLYNNDLGNFILNP